MGLIIFLLDEFYHAGELIYKPNIIFKVAKGISRNTHDRNYDLLMKALECTGKKMIPTYLLCDCEMDKDTPPELLSVMGCRTRVVSGAGFTRRAENAYQLSDKGNRTF